MVLTAEQKGNAEDSRYITFQQDIAVDDGESTLEMRPRTLEEAFIYQNFKLLKRGRRSLKLEIPDSLDEVYQKIYELVKSSSFKKTDFAMQVLSCNINWQVPKDHIAHYCVG
jgi:putative ATP-dependent endonuclease of OLD family